MKATKTTDLSTDKKLLDQCLESLITCKYFGTMTPKVLREVLMQSTYMEVPAGTTLIYETSSENDIFFLLEGSLAVSSEGKVILRLNSLGDIVGEFALVSDEPRSADVTTEKNSRLIQVSSNVMAIAQDDRELAIQFLTVFSHIMAAKLRETSDRARLYEDAVLEAQEIATSHTKLESEIQEKLQQIRLYSKVIETTKDAVIVTDFTGVVQQFNPAAEWVFPQLKEKKGKKGKIKSTTILQLVEGFDLSTYKQGNLVAPWRGEWQQKDELAENTIVYQVTVTPIPGSSEGQVVGVAYQLRDISIQKAQERAIEAKNEEVRKGLVELEATYQELQRSDKLKAETLSVVSEELSSPVRKLLAFSEKLIAEITATDSTVYESIISLQEQGHYIKAIADNISHLLDIQKNFQSINTTQVDLTDLLEEIQRDLTPLANQRKITFEQDLGTLPLILLADREQLRMVLNLLLEQALLVSAPKSKIQLKSPTSTESPHIPLEIFYDGPNFANMKPMSGESQGRFAAMVGLPLARKVISQAQGNLQFLGDNEHAQIHLVLPRSQKEGSDRSNRIMILDFQDMDRMITQGVIEHLWEDAVLFSTADPFEFLDNYEDFLPDLVILDPQLADSSWQNHRILSSLIQNRRHTCPVLSLSNLYKDFSERTVAVERGVTDFLAKPYSIFDLRFKVKSMLQSHRKEETLHANMDQAQKQAFTDGLTKLANRKNFDGFLETQLNYSRQTQKPCSLIMLDIDNFKFYNDTHGHQNGDEVLKVVAKVLSKSVRSSDLAARYGGEEFVLVLPETKKEMAVVIAEKVRRAINDSDIPHSSEQPLGVLSASFGVATFDDDASTDEELIKAADVCLYKAKQEGRNTVIAAESEKPSKSTRQAAGTQAK